MTFTGYVNIIPHVKPTSIKPDPLEVIYVSLMTQLYFYSIIEKEKLLSVVSIFSTVFLGGSMCILSLHYIIIMSLH